MSRAATTFISTAGSPASSEQQHAWHSPVPYLFGGLAAMLGLIAFALLILACSYWKLSAFPEGDVEAGGEKEGGEAGKAAEEGRGTSNVVVIMPGHLRPTFLATPSTSRASSFTSSTSTSTSTSSADCESTVTTSQPR